MKYFLKKIAIFFVPLVVLFVFTIGYFFYYKSKVAAQLEKIAQYECIIMGDSQMQRIKPEKIDLKTINFASSGEHYLFTFKKLKMLLEANNKIKQIILGVSTHSFAPVYNKLIDTKYAEGRASITKYLYFVSSPEDTFIKKHDLVSKNTIQAIYKGPEWQGLYISKKKNPDTTIINKAFVQHFGNKKNEKPDYTNQVIYLKKIEKLCQENKINLVLVSTPYHQLYVEQVEKNYFDILSQTIKSMPNTKYVSFLNNKVSPELMSDGNHLNTFGGDLYSAMLNDSISKK
jgi:uncharacterized phage-associated protein